MKVALVHDWLTGMRGGEWCLHHFLQAYPEAEICTLLHVPGSTLPTIEARVRQVSFLQKLPGVARYYRALLPLFPRAVASLDLSGYDLVISLSHAAAKNVRAAPGAVHICYCFTPMRYVWDQRTYYFGKLTPLLWPLLSWLRSWDREGSAGVREFVAISNFVAARIRSFYGRRAAVVYPPVETRWITPAAKGVQGEAYLYAGALVPYKRVDALIDAFNHLGTPLWIVGDGPERRRLEARSGSNITFHGRVSDERLADFYRRSRALLFPGKEDFGMVPVEALAAGRPVVGLNAGGLRDTVGGVPGEGDVQEGLQVTPFGVLFDEVSLGREVGQERVKGMAGAIVSAVRKFEQIEGSFSVEKLKARASEFSPEHFRESWCEFLIARGLSGYLPLQDAWRGQRLERVRDGTDQEERHRAAGIV